MKKKSVKKIKKDTVTLERGKVMLAFTIFITGLPLISTIYLFQSELIAVYWMTMSVFLLDLFAYWILIGRNFLFKK